MNALENAREADFYSRPEDAAQFYENVIANGSGDVESYLDLALIYFVSLDFGYQSAHQLSESFLDNAFRRLFELLEEMKDRFGLTDEIEFWTIYIRFIILDEDPNYDRCEQIVRNGHTLTPYFHLLSKPGTDDYRNQARRLLETVSRGESERKRYVRSVLEGYSAIHRL